jgi:hypothetical protein
MFLKFSFILILCVAIGLCISSCKLSSRDCAKNQENAYVIAERNIIENLPEGVLLQSELDISWF